MVAMLTMIWRQHKEIAYFYFSVTKKTQQRITTVNNKWFTNAH